MVVTCPWMCTCFTWNASRAKNRRALASTEWHRWIECFLWWLIKFKLAKTPLINFQSLRPGNWACEQTCFTWNPVMEIAGHNRRRGLWPCPRTDKHEAILSWESSWSTSTCVAKVFRYKNTVCWANMDSPAVDSWSKHELVALRVQQFRETAQL